MTTKQLMKLVDGILRTPIWSAEQRLAIAGVPVDIRRIVEEAAPASQTVGRLQQAILDRQLGFCPTNDEPELLNFRSLKN